SPCGAYVSVFRVRNVVSGVAVARLVRFAVIATTTRRAMTDESDGELRVSIHPEDGDEMYLAAAATESAQEGELWAGAESAEEDELPVATASVEEGDLPVTTESAEEGELWAGAESAEESELPEVSRKVTPRSRTRRTRPRSRTIALRRLTR